MDGGAQHGEDRRMEESGVTKQERVIVSAHTGFLMCDFDEVHKYIEKQLGRPVWTHELTSPEMEKSIREATKPDFLALCQEDSDEVDKAAGVWLTTDAYPHNVYCSSCYKTYAQSHWAIWKDGSLPRAYCPNCGKKMKSDESGDPA